MKKYIKYVFITLIIFIPTLFIIIYSSIENRKFHIDNDYVFQEKAYGISVELNKKDFQSYILLSGSIDLQDIKIVEYDSHCIILAEEGEEIYKGMPIAAENDNIIYADFTGIMEKIERNEKISLVIKPFEQYIFSTIKPDVWNNKKTLKVEDIHDHIYDLQLIYESKLDKKKPKMLFKINGDQLSYGETLNLFLKDKMIKDVYFINKNAVYYDKQMKSHKIRLLDNDNNVIEDVDVKIIGEDFNDYAIDYDESKGHFADLSYGNFMNQKTSIENNESTDENQEG